MKMLTTFLLLAVVLLSFESSAQDPTKSDYVLARQNPSISMNDGLGGGTEGRFIRGDNVLHGNHGARLLKKGMFAKSSRRALLERLCTRAACETEKEAIAVIASFNDIVARAGLEKRLPGDESGDVNVLHAMLGASWKHRLVEAKTRLWMRHDTTKFVTIIDEIVRTALTWARDWHAAWIGDSCRERFNEAVTDYNIECVEQLLDLALSHGLYQSQEIKDARMMALEYVQDMRGRLSCPSCAPIVYRLFTAVNCFMCDCANTTSTQWVLNTDDDSILVDNARHSSVACESSGDTVGYLLDGTLQLGSVSRNDEQCAKYLGGADNCSGPKQRSPYVVVLKRSAKERNPRAYIEIEVYTELTQSGLWGALPVLLGSDCSDVVRRAFCQLQEFEDPLFVGNLLNRIGCSICEFADSVLGSSASASEENIEQVYGFYSSLVRLLHKGIELGCFVDEEVAGVMRMLLAHARANVALHNAGNTMQLSPCYAASSLG